MLRFETQKTGEVEITHRNEVVSSYPTYSNVIKEPITHFPTGHYVSLVSAYTPLKYSDFGQFSINYGEHPLVKDDCSIPIRSFTDLISRFNTNSSELTITPEGKIKISFLKPDEEEERPEQLNLILSASAAWFLGFKQMKTVFTQVEDNNRKFSVYSDFAYPPASIRYLQVICKNACGTTDSNMTMPTTMGIMHVTDHLSLINPHIAVNHRIEKGRIIDIEILDQDNHPFIWAPVYLELFVSESAEHEKKQGFFRFEKSHAVHLHAPIKMISLPNVFAAEPAYVLNLSIIGRVSYGIGEIVRLFRPQDDEFCKKFIGTVLTRNAVLAIFARINQYFKDELGPVCHMDFSNIDLIKAKIVKNTIYVWSERGRLEMNDFLKIFVERGGDLREEVTVEPYQTRIFNIEPDLLYADNARLNIYCKEYHDRFPIAVARRINDYYQIVNRAFWSWHEFEKATNILHFRVDRIIMYPDGSVSHEPWPVDKELLLQLFYK